MQLCLLFIILSVHAGNHTIEGMEDYETISAAFSVTFDEINHLQQTGFVNVNGNPYPIELFLRSDMKVGDTMHVLSKWHWV